MPCDCDQYARVDLWVGNTLCQRCPMCGATTVSHMEPPASPPMEPPAPRGAGCVYLAFLALCAIVALVCAWMELHWLRP